jgi:hypothetical protein
MRAYGKAEKHVQCPEGMPSAREKVPAAMGKNIFAFWAAFLFFSTLFNLRTVLSVHKVNHFRDKRIRR